RAQPIACCGGPAVDLGSAGVRRVRMYHLLAWNADPPGTGIADRRIGRPIPALARELLGRVAEPAWSGEAPAGGIAMVKAVIFDIDGTLIDSVDLHARAWQAALRHFGYDLPLDRIRAQIGKGGDQLMPALLPREDVERRGEEIEADRLDLFRREDLPH